MRFMLIIPVVASLSACADLTPQQNAALLSAGAQVFSAAIHTAGQVHTARIGRDTTIATSADATTRHGKTINGMVDIANNTPSTVAPEVVEQPAPIIVSPSYPPVP